MSASFASASSQELVNTAPGFVGAYPFTVGFWVYPTTTGTSRTVWSLSDTAGSSNLFRFTQGTTRWQLTAASTAGGSATAQNAVAPVANQWMFVLLRFISATNRRMALLRNGTVSDHSQNTTSITPAGIDAMAIGCNHDNSPDGFFDGSVAEFFLCDSDIQADGAQLQDSMLRQLAMQGPFSLPHIRRNIVEYRSFRSRGLDSRSDDSEEVYHRETRQVWTNTNTVQLGPHPPAAENWHRPLDPYTPPAVLV